MGEISGMSGDQVSTSPEGMAKGDLAVGDGKFETDVEGVFANGEKGGFPVFDVSKKEFYNNMKVDRKRLRFNKDTVVSDYMRKTKYNKTFYVRNTDDGFLRKIK